MGGEYIIVKQNLYMRAFRKAEATDCGHARTLAQLGVHETGIFRRMVDKGVFVATGGDAYYLDENAASDFVAQRRKRAFFTLALMFLILLLIWAFGGKWFR